MPHTAEPGRKMSAADERMMLFHHGSIPWRLTAGAILQTARADMARKATNAEIRHQRKRAKTEAQRKAIEPRRRYAFFEPHVESVASAEDLLRWAIEHRFDGLGSDVVETLAIYAMAGGLEAALVLAMAQEDAA